MASQRSSANLFVRNARFDDIPQISALVGKVYPHEATYTHGMLRGQISAFGEGQFVVLLGEEVVGYAATFRIKEARAFDDHSWVSITGDGHAARHDGTGDWLYGMEVCVDPSHRRLKIGQRLYNARQGLCQELGLKGIVFGGRLPSFTRQRKRYPTPEAYLEAAQSGVFRDPVLNFQMRAGFEPERVLHNYNADDIPSGGHAVLMVWRNPDWRDADNMQVARRNPETVRIVTVQQAARTVKSAEEFFENVAYFVKVASDYGGDFVVFPELFTLQLLAAEPELPPEKAIERLSQYTGDFVERMTSLALSRNINIIGGSHPTVTDDGDIQNVAYVFLRDGSVHAQEKLHPTPDERYWWNIQGGDTINAIETDCGPIGVMVCYDSEFPEIGRRLADQGARILFVPYCTDTRQGHLRVRYCCQARAIENQAYVATAGLVGNLDHVANLDINYAQSAILTPCDFPFARDGIAADTTENIEMVAVADVNLATLNWARAEGSVRNLRDRRFDLYRTKWVEG